MVKPKLAGLLYILAPAFLIYFITESILRQAAVSTINPQSVNISNIMSQLPVNIRESINKRIHIGYLKDSIAKAATDTDRIFALCNYAEALENTKDKESIFNEVIQKYSNSKEASRAYIYFLENNASSKKITIPELHKYLSQFPQIDQFYIYSAALFRLRELKAENSEQIKLLTPLLDITPENRDFSRFYEYLAELLWKAEQKDLYLKAKKLEEEANKKLFIDRVIDEKLKTETQKTEQKK